MLAWFLFLEVFLEPKKRKRLQSRSPQSEKSILIKFKKILSKFFVMWQQRQHCHVDYRVVARSNYRFGFLHLFTDQ
jgi:hypothetical protein